MDHNLPNIRALNSRLALSNARLGRFIEGLVDQIDDLISASLAEDWPKVERLCQSLYLSSQHHGLIEVAAGAAEVARTLERGDNPQQAKRQLLQLIGRCGRVRMPRK